MATVVKRTIRSSPHRDSSQTWEFITELLSRGNDDEKREELESVKGIASSVISDRATNNSPIIVTCEGPRTRIYCTFDDDAIDGSDADENSLGYDPLKGDWQISLPCLSDDLSWVQDALKEKSERITARDVDTGISESTESKSFDSNSLTLDPRGFLGS